MFTDRSMSKGEKRVAVAVLAVCVLFLAVFSILDYCGFERLACADMYEDTLCAKVMWEHKSLFPDSYAFGNQFYVAATPVLCALIYGITGSLNTSMAIATSVMTALILLSMAYMLRPFVRNRLSIYLAALTLMGCAFSSHIVMVQECQLMFIMCSYYSCYIITAFAVTGDYFRAVYSGDKRPVGLLLSMLLCFAMGMQSLRQTCVTILPVLCFEAIRLIATKLRPGGIFPVSDRRPTVRAILYALSNGAGLLFIKLLHIPQYTIYTGTSIFNGAAVGDKIRMIFKALRGICGLDYITGKHAVFFAVVFAVNIGLVLFALFKLLKCRGDFRPLYCVWSLLVISILAVIAASVVTTVNLRSIYLFMYYPLVMLSAVIALDSLGNKGRCALTAVLCIVYAGNCYFSYIDDFRDALDDTVTPQQEICQLALDNGFSVIYGDYERTAPKIAIWSDGKLIGAGWDEETVFKVVPYINVRNVYGLEDYDKGLFVFTDRDYDRAMEEVAANGTELTYIGSAGRYRAYAASNQLLYPLSWEPY